jgi:hypothetical protein
VDYWNGTAWVTVANSAATLFTEAADATAGWYPAITLSLPSGAQIQGLKIRFVKTGSAAIRIDDVKLTASSITPAITTNGSLSEVTAIYGTASTASATTVTVTGGSLTSGIVATAPTGFEVSNDGANYGTTATFAQTSGFANGTLYLRLAANAAAGSYNNQVVTLSSTGASNQTLAIANSTVNQKSLRVTNLSAITKVYDGGSSATFTGDLDGKVGADVVSLVGTGTYASVNVGTGINVTSTATLTGAAAARHILDSAGATDVAIERIPGTLNDHYDPQAKVLRLSEGVYGARSLAAVGIAAHEAGHALQDAQGPFDKIPVILVLCGKIPPTTCTITYLRPRLLALTNIPIAKLIEALFVHIPSQNRWRMDKRGFLNQLLQKRGLVRPLLPATPPNL